MARAFVPNLGAAVAKHARVSARHAQEVPIVKLRSDAEREGHTEEEPRIFETLVDYPCEFQIKIIGYNNQGDLTGDMLQVTAEVCEVDAETVRYTTRDTDSGKYTSITLMAPVKSADMLYKMYDVISQDKRVRFKF